MSAEGIVACCALGLAAFSMFAAVLNEARINHLQSLLEREREWTWNPPLNPTENPRMVWRRQR